jgi:hypothetical protein
MSSATVPVAAQRNESPKLVFLLLGLLALLSLAAVGAYYFNGSGRPASETISFLTAVSGMLSVHISHSLVRWGYLWSALWVFFAIEVICVGLVFAGANDPPLPDAIAFLVGMLGIFGLHRAHEKKPWSENFWMGVGLFLAAAVLAGLAVRQWGVKAEVLTIAAAIAGLFSVHIGHMARRRRAR